MFHDTGLEELWIWSLRVKSALFEVDPVARPCLQRNWPCHYFPGFSNSSQIEKLIPLPVKSQVAIDDSPGGSVVPIALGPEQRKPVDCAEALPWDP